MRYYLPVVNVFQFSMTKPVLEQVGPGRAG